MKKLLYLLLFILIFIPLIIFGCSSGGGGGSPATTIAAPATTIVAVTTTTVAAATSTTTVAVATTTTTTTSGGSPTTTEPETPTTSTTTTTSPEIETTTTTTTSTSTTTTLQIVGTPEALTASDGNWSDRVALTWNAVSQATSYKVLRCTTSEGAYSLLGSTTEASYSDTTATAVTDYYYKVKALIGATEGALCTAEPGIRSNGVVYVAATGGDDAYNGVVSTKPFSTINKAIGFMDIGNNNTLKVAQGTYSSNISYLNSLSITSSSGLSNLVSFEGGYSNDFSSRAVDRITNLTALDFGSNYFHISRSTGSSPLKIEGFQFLYSLSGANSTVYATQLSDGGGGYLFNFCNNTVSMEASGSLRATALDLSLSTNPIGDGNHISNNKIWANAGTNCSAFGIANITATITKSNISNTIIENNRIDVVSGGSGTSCYGIAGAGTDSGPSICLIKNNVITAQSNGGTFLADIQAQANNAQIVNNTLISTIDNAHKASNIEIKTTTATAENLITIENNILYSITSEAVYRVGLFITSSGSGGPFYPPTYLKNNLFLNSSLTNSGGTQLTTGGDITSYIPSGYSDNLVSGDISSNIFTSKNDTSLNLGDYSLHDNPDLATYIINKGLFGDPVPTVDIIGTSRSNPPDIGAYEKI